MDISKLVSTFKVAALNWRKYSRPIIKTNIKAFQFLKHFVAGWGEQFTPFTHWLGELKNPATLKADLIGGLTVALVLIPQSMAYAQLAGLPPYYGLYASFLPGMIAAIFGSSRQLATGPVAVVSLMTASALEPLAGSNPEAYLAYAVVLAIFVGAFQLMLGLLRLGVLVNFLSHPVVVGFTNAAAIIIATSQLSKLFGVTVEKADHHYETVWRVVEAAGSQTHFPTLAMGVFSLLSLVLIKKYFPKLPNVLIVVVITTLISWLFNFSQNGGAVVGSIPDGLPGFKIPDAKWSEVAGLISTAIAIALIGFMEAISIAKAMAARTHQKLDPDQELIGQGLSNITSGFFQGYAVSGSFSRSAVSINAGSITGFSSIVTGLIVGITLLWLTPLLYHLPQATLASVIMVAVANLVKLEPMLYAYKVQKHDGIVSAITFILTLVLAPHLENGIITGVLLSLGLFLHKTMHPRVALLSRHPDGSLRDAEAHNLGVCQHISVVRFDMSLYFANSGYFEDIILQRVLNPRIRYIIVDCESMNQIDATGEEMLHSLARALEESGVEFLFSCLKLQVYATLIRTGFIEQLGEDHVFRTNDEALEYAWDRTYCEKEGCTGNCFLAKTHVDDVLEVPNAP